MLAKRHILLAKLVNLLAKLLDQLPRGILRGGKIGQATFQPINLSLKAGCLDKRGVSFGCETVRPLLQNFQTSRQTFIGLHQVFHEILLAGHLTIASFVLGDFAVGLVPDRQREGDRCGNRTQDAALPNVWSQVIQGRRSSYGQAPDGTAREPQPRATSQRYISHHAAMAMTMLSAIAAGTGAMLVRQAMAVKP